MLIAFRAVECTDGEEISLSKLSVSHVGQVGVISPRTSNSKLVSQDLQRYS